MKKSINDRKLDKRTVQFIKEAINSTAKAVAKTAMRECKDNPFDALQWLDEKIPLMKNAANDEYVVVQTQILRLAERMISHDD